MCNVCCKEFRGWCKSFTKTEALLSLLQAILLLVFIGFLTFLILHFLACSEPEINYESIKPNPNVTPAAKTVFYLTPSRAPAPLVLAASTKRETLSPDKQCTWTPSQKTAPTTHYYEYGAPAYGTTAMVAMLGTTARRDTYATLLSEENPAGTEESDGEEVEEGVDSLVLALVKIRPTRESAFGCVLTVVSRYWALTAASCLAAAEEVDSLDAFVMLEGYGARAGPGAAHSVAAVRVHPGYARAGGAGARDVAALRSEDPLPPAALRLPTVLDHLLVTIGERMTILGFGKFRTLEKSTFGRGVRAAGAYSLAAGACGRGTSWAARHLAGGAPALPATGDIAPICAGPLYARGVPCNFCAGTPLLTRERVLLGVQAGAGEPADAGEHAGEHAGEQAGKQAGEHAGEHADARCGGACEPAAFVSIAAVRDWLDETLANNIV